MSNMVYTPLHASGLQPVNINHMTKMPRDRVATITKHRFRSQSWQATDDDWNNLVEINPTLQDHH